MSLGLAVKLTYLQYSNAQQHAARNKETSQAATSHMPV